MRRVVMFSLVAVAMAVLTGACAQVMTSVVTTGEKGKLSMHTVRLRFHDPWYDACNIKTKPERIRASKGMGNPENRDVVVWELENKCEETLDICLVGFLPESGPSPTTPDPLEDVDDQNNPQPNKRRCDTVPGGQTGKIRTRVNPNAVANVEYEYNIRMRRHGNWETVDPMIDIVP